MRIRSIRPEFWASEDVAALDWHSRLVFIGLWSYVDDNGVGRDDERLITAALFPLEDDPRESVARVSRGLLGLFAGGQIVRYTVGGKPYLYVSAWQEHQRIDKRAKDRYPLPTCDDAIPRDTVATLSRQCRETVATGEGEKGRRGEGEKGQASSAPASAEVPDRPDMNPDAILQSHGMPDADRRAFKAWLVEERNVKFMTPWLTKVQTAGEVPELIQAWRVATKPKKVHPTRDPKSPSYNQDWMYNQ